jgi:transcriptional regulator with XRE-family HTH domain
MPGTPRQTPAQLAPAPWPGLPSADDTVEVARFVSSRLQAALSDRSVRSLSRDSGVPDGTILRILNGSTWPDIRTVARLERALDSDLYPTRADRAASPSADRLPHD